jgi:hypothetical protein
MAAREWINSEPGVLALFGTDFRIEYHLHTRGNFALYEGARLLRRWEYLSLAKDEAEHCCRSLDEMGTG